MGAEPKTRTLKLRNITVDAAIQPRAAGLDEATVEEYAAAMKAGAAFPPCRVFKSAGGSLWLSRGFHRYAGAERAGLVEIECEVVNGDRKDAIIDAACSNTDHGLKRTNADKRKAVEILLRECPEWSDNRLADAAGVSHPFVAGLRAQVVTVTTCEEPAKRVGKDGKAYTVKPKADPKPVEPTPDEVAVSVPADEPECRVCGGTGEDANVQFDPAKGEGYAHPCEACGGSGYDTEQAGGGGEESGADSQAAPGVGDATTTAEPTDPAAEFVGRINRLCHAIDAAKKEATELGSVDVFGRHIHVESVAAQLQAARSALHQSRPTEPCNCTKEGKSPAAACRACFGAGVCPASRVLKGGR